MKAAPRGQARGGRQGMTSVRRGARGRLFAAGSGVEAGRDADFDFHAFGGGTHPGIVIAGLAHDALDAGVVVVGIVMEEDEFLGAALHHHVDGFAPVTVAPAPAADFIFLGQVLGVVDEHVRTFGQLAYLLVEYSLARLVVGRVNQHAVARFHAEARQPWGWLRDMVRNTQFSIVIWPSPMSWK